MKISAISDLHLEFIKNNLWEQYKKKVDVKELAKRFSATFNALDFKENFDFGVIAGDTTHCMEDEIEFYTYINELVKKPFFIVMGNHNWNWDSSFKSNTHTFQGLTWEEQENILEKNIVPLKNIYFLKAGKVEYFNNLKIIGDCGFAAYSDFNASRGIYRQIINVWKEKELTERWRKEYKKHIENFISGDKLLVITHTPIEDWGENIHPDVYYISGHIHADSDLWENLL